MTASLVVACSDDGTGASGLASSGTDSNSSGGSGSASGGPTTTGAPTGSTGAMTGAESSSTSASGTTSTSDTTTEEGTTVSSSTTSPASCGNGIIDGTEQCDGADLNDFTCEALGNDGGTLQCDPVTCTFDTQLCEGGGGTTG